MLYQLPNFGCARTVHVVQDDDRHPDMRLPTSAKELVKTINDRFGKVCNNSHNPASTSSQIANSNLLVLIREVIDEVKKKFESVWLNIKTVHYGVRSADACLQALAFNIL